MKAVGVVSLVFSVPAFVLAAIAGADWYNKYPTDDPDPRRLLIAFGLIGMVLLVLGILSIRAGRRRHHVLS